MSQQRARHRRHKALTMRVGATLAIPTLVAAAIYAAASSDDDPSAERTIDDSDVITFAPADPTVDPAPSPTATPSPSASPTDATPSAEPTGTVGPSPSPSTEPDPENTTEPPESDDGDRRTPEPTYTYSLPPDSPPEDPPDDDDPPEDDPPDDDDPPEDDPPEDDPPAAVQKLLAEVQALRAGAGCSALNVDGPLMTAAQQYSEGRRSDPDDLAKRAGYNGKTDGFRLRSLQGFVPEIDGRDRHEVTDCKYDHVGIGREDGFLTTRWAVMLGHPD